MPNEAKIKGKIVEMGLTINHIAKEMNLTPYSLGKKIAGKARMTLEEARFLQRRLSISDEDIVSYFFTH